VQSLWKERVGKNHKKKKSKLSFSKWHENK
jgi:hypothetical protein